MLQRPFFTPTVIALWFVTTGWLTIAKILPDWQPGSPPGQQTLYASGERLLPVAWTVFCNEQPVGWAITRTTRSADRGVFVDSHLHFDRLPWDKMLPGWATLLVQRLVPGNDPGTFDARGRLAIDEAGDLRSFSSVVHLPGTDQPLVLTGTVEDGTVAIKVTAGELGYEATRHLPTTAMLGDELSPQATLPDLHEGRRWTVPVYSPLRPGRSPIEVLHAEVGGEETMYWEDGFVQAKVAQTVVAHQLGAMTAEAVVDEELGAVLQRRHVVGPIGRLVPGNAAAGCMCASDEDARQQSQGQLFECCHVRGLQRFSGR